jgi:hypothetical protein
MLLTTEQKHTQPWILTFTHRLRNLISFPQKDAQGPD